MKRVKKAKNLLRLKKTPFLDVKDKVALRKIFLMSNIETPLHCYCLISFLTLILQQNAEKMFDFKNWPLVVESSMIN